MKPHRNRARPRPWPPALVPMTGTDCVGETLYRGRRSGTWGSPNRAASRSAGVRRVYRAHMGGLGGNGVSIILSESAGSARQVKVGAGYGHDGATPITGMVAGAQFGK